MVSVRNGGGRRRRQIRTLRENKIPHDYAAAPWLVKAISGPEREYSVVSIGEFYNDRDVPGSGHARRRPRRRP